MTYPVFVFQGTIAALKLCKQPDLTHGIILDHQNLVASADTLSSKIHNHRYYVVNFDLNGNAIGPIIQVFRTDAILPFLPGQFGLIQNERTVLEFGHMYHVSEDMIVLEKMNGYTVLILP